MTMTNVNPHEPRRRNSGRTKPSWRVIKFYKRIHDSTILSINMPFQANRQFSPISLFLALSFVLFYSLSFPSVIQLSLTTSQFPWISHVFRIRFEHIRFIISAFRAAVITRRIDSRFFLLFFIRSPFLSFSHFLSFSPTPSLTVSLILAHYPAIIHTAWPLEIVVSNYDISTRYLYIYKSVGWITFSRVHDSSFCCIHPEGGEGVSRV